MLFKTNISLLTALAVVGRVDAGFIFNKVPYCLPMGPIFITRCWIPGDIYKMDTTAYDMPTIEPITPMYLSTPFRCWDVTYVRADSMNLFLRLPAGTTCLDVQFATGKWCVGRCGRRRRERELMTIDTGVPLQPEDDLYQEYVDECGNYEYNVSLQVQDTHLMAVATPKQDGMDAGCPLMVSHSKYDPDTGKHEKEVLAFGDDDDEETREQAKHDLNTDSYPIGTFKGSELAKAHESVDITEVMGNNNQSYDIVSNNCATFLMALAKSLNVKIDADMTAFVARRLLLQSSTDFIERIRSSVNFQSLFSGINRNLRGPGGTASDEEIIHRLVEQNAVAGGMV